MSYVLKERFREPSEALYLTEPIRAIFELGTLPLYEPWLNSLRGGDGDAKQHDTSALIRRARDAGS